MSTSRLGGHRRSVAVEAEAQTTRRKAPVATVLTHGHSVRQTAGTQATEAVEVKAMKMVAVKMVVMMILMAMMIAKMVRRMVRETMAEQQEVRHRIGRFDEDEGDANLEKEKEEQREQWHWQWQ